MTVEVTQLARIFELSEETLLHQAVAEFLDKAIAESERRLGQLHVDDQRFQRKYGMRYKELLTALDGLEENVSDDDTFHGVPMLEVVSDTRAWEHVRENLSREEERLNRLLSLS